MQLVHAIPISRGIAKESLLYFSSRTLKKGSVVFIPLRTRVVPSIVIDVEDALDAKLKIRKSEYVIKKVESHKSIELFLPQFIAAVQETADHFACTTGAMLHSLVPQALLTDLESITCVNNFSNVRNNTAKNEKLVFQADPETRLLTYRSLVREEFARKRSVYLIVATIQEAQYIATHTARGIEQYVFVLHGGLSKKETVVRFNAALSSKHPVLIIATGMFLSLPRTDIATIIVERESARAYKTQSRPFTDMRTFAQIWAKHTGTRIIFADMPLRVETQWQLEHGEFEELIQRKHHADNLVDQTLVDMRKDYVKNKKKFSVISSNLANLLEETNLRKRTIIFSARRGIASNTVCEDCGSTVTCSRCSAPVVLHKGKKENVFVCHKCGNMRSAHERCATCTSWKLKPLGVGNERIRQEIENLFPNLNIYIINKDTANTHTKAKNIALEFYKTKGSVLICTEMALPYLRKSVDYVAVASIDSLLSLPDPKVHERAFSLLLRLRALAEKEFLMQTRQPELPLLTYILQGDIGGFYQSEIKDRKRFNYPPFTTLIKIISIGSRTQAITEMENVESKLSKVKLQIYPAFTPVVKGKYALNALIRVPRNTWPDKKLLIQLRSLPPNITINVDPEHIL